MNWLNQREVTITFGWLNADRAAQIVAICKRHGATCRRLAQERGALGYCKVVATFRKNPGWYANNQDAGVAKREVIEAGLTNDLTFQR